MYLCIETLIYTKKLMKMISQNENIAFEWSSADNYNGFPLKEVNLSSCSLEDVPKFINVLPNLEVTKIIFLS